MSARVMGGMAALALLAGCGASAPTAEDLAAKARTATAAVVTGVTPEVIEIANLERLPAKATWDAKTPDGHFSCTSDEHFGLPDCQPSGS